ncbi:hypothetical protein FcAc13_11865, partial [Frischella sp. Ac13]
KRRTVTPHLPPTLTTAFLTSVDKDTSALLFLSAFIIRMVVMTLYTRIRLVIACRCVKGKKKGSSALSVSSHSWGNAFTGIP